MLLFQSPLLVLLLSSSHVNLVSLCVPVVQDFDGVRSVAAPASPTVVSYLSFSCSPFTCRLRFLCCLQIQQTRRYSAAYSSLVVSVLLGLLSCLLAHHIFQSILVVAVKFIPVTVLCSFVVFGCRTMATPLRLLTCCILLYAWLLYFGSPVHSVTGTSFQHFHAALLTYAPFYSFPQLSLQQQCSFLQLAYQCCVLVWKRLFSVQLQWNKRHPQSPPM